MLQHSSKKQKTRQTKKTKPIPRPDVAFKGLSSKVAERRWVRFQFRIGLPDKGFTDQTIKEFDFIGTVVEKQGIKRLCKIPNSYNLTLVREFYAELAVNKLAKSISVRGVPISLKASRFNELYGLHPPKHTEFHRLTKHATVADLNEVIEVVGKPGAKWEDHTNFMLRVFKSFNLNANANVWINFIRHTISPTTHDSSICVERMLLLFCLMTGKSINMGRCMLKGVRLCSTRSRGKLYLPYTITKLLKKNGVPIYQDDQIVKEDTEKWEIDMKAVSRLRDRKEKATSGADMTGMLQDLVNQNSTLINSLVNQKKEFEEMLEFHQSEMMKIVEQNEESRKMIREEIEAEYREQIESLKRKLKQVKAEKKSLKKECKKMKLAATSYTAS